MVSCNNHAETQEGASVLLRMKPDHHVKPTALSDAGANWAFVKQKCVTVSRTSET